ncbi:hypothetical protein GGX14DRAFT_399465 [Mycena pura]|uniref:Uncharacterized protein n=1 Tax=Mycena pura TaxID=153505 RepID=A0AAD6Y6Q7_9AGAR|nr:hypothetical protein GGX14DRAFT_399465 [Mycena pura]
MVPPLQGLAGLHALRATMGAKTPTFLKGVTQSIPHLRVDKVHVVRSILRCTWPAASTVSLAPVSTQAHNTKTKCSPPCIPQRVHARVCVALEPPSATTQTRFETVVITGAPGEWYPTHKLHDSPLQQPVHCLPVMNSETAPAAKSADIEHSVRHCTADSICMHPGDVGHGRIRQREEQVDALKQDLGVFKGQPRRKEWCGNFAKW